MLLCLLFLVLVPSIVQGDDIIVPQERISTFFQKLEQRDVESAYTELTAGSSIAAHKPEALEPVKRQTTEGITRYGNIGGADFVKEEKFGESLVRLVYIARHEYAPTVWEFYFYKPCDVWFLTTLNFNDRFDLLK